MGNGQSAGRKRNRSGRGKVSPKSPDQKRARRGRAPDDAEDDVKCLTPGKSASPAARLKWKPANGSAKLTQSATPPSPSTSCTSSATTTRRRGDKKEKEPPLVPVTSGPRSRKGDSAEMFAVEAVIKKWVGPSDRSEKDVFYLIHFAGQKRPPLKNAHENLWQHPTQMRECKALIDELDQRTGKPEKTKRAIFYYTDESEPDEPVDQRLVFQSSEVNGRSLRKRDNGSASVSDDKAAGGRKQKKERTAAAAIGFDRSLDPDTIVGSTHFKRQLLYAIKWKGCDKVDFVVSTLCHEKAPELVIDYLVSKLQNVPAVTSAELALV